MSVILQAIGLAKTYNPGTPAQVDALKPTDLEIKEGCSPASSGAADQASPRCFTCWGPWTGPAAAR